MLDRFEVFRQSIQPGKPYRDAVIAIAKAEADNNQGLATQILIQLADLVKSVTPENLA